MLNRIRQTEWPLVAFTLAIQFSTGLALVSALCDSKLLPGQAGTVRLIAMAAFPMAAFGMLASWLHIGRPRAGWRALLNLRNSVLSREILVSLLYLFASAVYGFWWWAGLQTGRIALGLVASLLGICAVFLSSMVYLIPTQPVWNSWWVPCSFMSTTLLLAGFAAGVALPQGADFVVASSVTAVLVVATVASLVAAAKMFVQQAQITARSVAGDRIVLVVYCFVICLIPVWSALRLHGTLTSAEVSEFADAAILMALVSGGALQRLHMYRSARIPQF